MTSHTTILRIKEQYRREIKNTASWKPKDREWNVCILFVNLAHVAHKDNQRNMLDIFKLFEI